MTDYIHMNYPDPNWCPLCGEPRGVCLCCDDDIDEWFDDFDAYDELGEASHCGCPYCYCSNLTVAGETCNECLSGAHQG